jgi:hypothetical protein
VSFKKPNTAWFIPAEFESRKSEQKKFISISQIYALTHKKIVISSSSDLNRIWLQANYIDTLEFPKRYSPLVENKKTENKASEESGHLILGFPGFLPFNYHNQNYVVEKIEAPDLILNNANSKIDSSLYSFMEIFFEVHKNEEPVNFVIKELKFKNGYFKNIYVFIYKKFIEDGITKYKDGYVYTDVTGKTKIASWIYNEEMPFNEQDYQEEIETYKKYHPDDSEEKIKELMTQDGIMEFKENDFDSQEAIAWIDEVEKEAKKALEQYGDYKKIEKLYENYKKHPKLAKKDKKKQVSSRSKVKKQKNKKQVIRKALKLARAVTMQKRRRVEKKKVRTIVRALDLAYAVNKF